MQSKNDLKIIETSGAVVFNGGNVLLVRHEKDSRQELGVYGLPAGRIEEGERAIDTALRELFEETGLIAKIEDLEEIPGERGAWIELKDGRHYCTFNVYLVRRWTGELRGEEDRVTPFWVPIEKLSEYNMLPNVHEVILSAKSL